MHIQDASGSFMERWNQHFDPECGNESSFHRGSNIRATFIKKKTKKQATYQLFSMCQALCSTIYINQLNLQNNHGP